MGREIQYIPLNETVIMNGGMERMWKEVDAICIHRHCPNLQQQGP
jgi:hypothetical protein